MDSKKKIALNSIIITSQRLSSVLLALVSTPIILKALGIEDYGIYVLSVGFVGGLAFLNLALTSATRRYIAFSLGQKDFTRLSKIFSISFIIHFFYALLSFLIIFFVSLFWVESILTIPIERIDSTKIVLIFVGFITFFEIISVPFNGVFQAYENFTFISVLGLFESLSKLVIAFLLLIVSGDKLIFYSMLLGLLAGVLFVIRSVYLNKKFKEIKFGFLNFDKLLFKEMLGFISWSFIGSISIVGRNQAISIILNIFFGVVSNAAYGIGNQIRAGISIFSIGVVQALTPRIVKLAGEGDTEKMLIMMRTMSKTAVLIVSIVVLPIIFQTEYILTLWLKEFPSEAPIFVKLILINGLIMGQSHGINQVFEAINKIKEYHLNVSIIILMNIPISIVLFKLGAPAYSILVVSILLEFLSFLARLFMLKKHLDYSIIAYLNDIFTKVIFPMFIPIIFALLVEHLLFNEILKLLLTLSVFVIIYPIFIYFISLDITQRKFVQEFLYSIKKKIKIKK